MSGSSHGSLEQALDLGTQMLGAARQWDWETVYGLRRDYDTALHAGASGEPLSYDLLLQIEQQHQQLVQLTTLARDAVGDELKQQRHNHRALSAYLSSSHVR